MFLNLFVYNDWVVMAKKRASKSVSRRSRRVSKWEGAMKLGLIGLIAAFAFRAFYDTFIMGSTPDYNYALYHGIVFGVVVTLVWKFWPWQEA